jgi:hypothetical protein
VTFHMVQSVWRHDGVGISESALVPRGMVISGKENFSLV